MFSIKVLAAAGVLSTSAPPLAASKMFLSIEIELNQHETLILTFVKWNALGGTGMILNVDGISIDNHGVSSFGGLIQNADSAWVHGFFGNLRVTNIIHPELMAMYKGLLLAWDLNAKDLWCYSDSKMAIKLITEPVDEWHHYATMLNNIKELLNRDWRVLILHTFREGNSCTDYLAKHGANNTDVFVSIAIAPGACWAEPLAAR
ncbi:hypothetical protein TSUD_146430 [Trifolium subterraneum]|uniref:RNase H type-1 domain-containing protein n=1 Tax=Trifolium subterraneum TaxID=3900 RepID=A0A2Z6N7A1_TRISU|nr:hypothetical protein TSUD_146430 [Trifolium subterraneum]